MSTDYRAALQAIPRLRAILFSSALVAICSVGGSAFAASPTPPPARPDIVMSVKNATAQKLAIDARNAYRGGNAGLALTLLRRAANAAPKDGWVQLMLGRVLLQTGSPMPAELQLRQARENGVPDAFVLPALFDAMVARHDEIKLLNEFPAPAANAKDVASADILRARAMAMLSLGRTEDAAAEMDRSLSVSRNARSLLARAAIAAKQNNLSLENNLTDEALKLAPKDGPVMVAKLRILVRQDNDIAALALSEQVLKALPNDLETRAIRIDIFLKQNQEEKAKGELNILTAKAPKSAFVPFYNALFLARANNPTDAWKIIGLLLPDFTNNNPAYAVPVSKMAVNSGHVETAIAILARALAKSPDRTDVRTTFASVRLRQGDPDAALKLMEPVKNSADPLVLDMLGNIDLEAGHNHDALEKLTRAHGARPKDGEITFHLVLALDASANRNAAKDLLKSLLAGGGYFDDLQMARQLEKSWH
ncbi:MAG TPA: tetratricopeptide repeat protein [Rhizomicrobium sp.]|nr:tetratricopeptide repeat protein [Rhizomicrobium sp.]